MAANDDIATTALLGEHALHIIAAHVSPNTRASATDCIAETFECGAQLCVALRL